MKTLLRLPRHSREGLPTSEQGQVMVIMALAIVAMVAIVGLVIDAGYAWGQQRDSQNAADAAAEAGATQMAENLPFLAEGAPLPNQNSEVAAAVVGIATATDVQIDEAWYTDFDGDRVGAGPLIGPSALPAGDDPPVDADGVEVTTSKTFNTFIAGVVGMPTMTTQTRGTAVSGYVPAFSQNVLPVAFPLTITTCTNNNNVLEDPLGQQWRPDLDYLIPLCSSSPGNVGWLDWDPPPNPDTSECDQGNGNPELECAILTPDNPEITTPDWYYVASTGNISVSYIEDALMTYAAGDQVVIIPIFDASCQDEPLGTATADCTSGPGTGQQQWYHLRGWAGFDIEWVDLNGGPSTCGSGNGATGCFKGQFRYFGGLPSGTLSEATGNETVLDPVGVLLIDSK